MSRFIYFLTLFLAFIGSTLAQVQSINTPGGSVANGATITITWIYTTQPNPLPGTLSVVDNTTKNTVIISSNVTLSTQSYRWTVNVPAGTYYLALNDGSGDKYSGTFTVFQAGAPPAPAASGTAAAAPPAASGAPAASSPAAAPAATSAAAQPQPPPQPSPKPPANTESSAAKSSSTPTPPAASAASFTGSSISGYKLLFSLIVVAAVMVHFA